MGEKRENKRNPGVNFLLKQSWEGEERRRVPYQKKRREKCILPPWTLGYVHFTPFKFKDPLNFHFVQKNPHCR